MISQRRAEALGAAGMTAGGLIVVGVGAAMGGWLGVSVVVLGGLPAIVGAMGLVALVEDLWRHGR